MLRILDGQKEMNQFFIMGLTSAALTVIICPTDALTSKIINKDLIF